MKTFALVTPFLTLALANQAQAQKMRTRIGAEESEKEGERALEVFDLFIESSVSLSLSMPAIEAAYPLAADGLMSSTSTMNHNKGKKSSKNSHVSCLFANPAIVQAEELENFGISEMLEHALMVNELLEELLEVWLSRVMTRKDILEYGEILGGSFHEGISLSHTIICSMESALLLQMEGTCNYSKHAQDYETIVLALMAGFATGVGLFDFEGCL